ncbi:unnamed protein product [Rhizoctonia solani]|uniref:ARID domain-containing protein n=1 Tax=Rhizoctonia solani TaxID=456999 RepID=A0A8H3I288_9AGAM|nr:unnamed protein product [Rhizoctonia solani]
MSQNVPDASSHTGQPTIEELRRKITHAREQTQAYLGRGDTSHWEELGLETAVSMLAHVEDMLGRGLPQSSSSATTSLSSTPRTSNFMSTIGSGAAPSTTQAPSSLSTSAAPVNLTPTNVATHIGLPGVAALNAYSEPAIPSDRLTFSYLWKLWALQNRKTQRDIPTLGGKFLDLHSLALNINSLGGHSEMNRNTSLWKRLAVQLKLIDHETQDNEYSKRVVDMLQNTQKELLLPFEQYCVLWSCLSDEEKNNHLVEYTAATTSTRANLPSSMPEVGEMLLPTSTISDCGPTMTLAPNAPELQEATKLVDTYFYGFYPGIRLHTKIERLLKLPPSEFPKHTWTRKRLDWLSKFSQKHAGRSTDQIIACMTVVIQQQLQEKKLAPMPPSGWPAKDVKVTEILPPTSNAMFSPSLIVQANRFVERTLQAVEEVRSHMKRIELPDIHQEPLKALVTEAYDLALFFYRAVALHYMLFLNEKDTRSVLMHSMLIIEQFFLSSTGHPAHIIGLEYAVASVTRIRDVVDSMRDAYAKRYRDIGDWYPERNLFQILIALTSGPRFALVFLWWFITRVENPKAAAAIAICGVIRTVSCGGWVYITSNDDHDVHDVLMILYMVCNLPWMLGSISYTPQGHHASRNRRKITASLFFGALPPMIYFFIRHKVQRIPGAYTHYSFFEWWLIVADVAFDSLKSAEFSTVEISVRAVGSSSAEIEKPTVPENDALADPTRLSTKMAVPKALPVITEEKKVDGAMVDVAPSNQSDLITSLVFSPVATYATDLYL